MVYMEIRYGIQGEYLCCTFGARVLHFWCQSAALFLALLFVSLYSGFSVGQTFWFSFDHDCTLTGQMGFKTDFAWKKANIFFLNTNRTNRTNLLGCDIVYIRGIRWISGQHNIIHTRISFFSNTNRTNQTNLFRLRHGIYSGGGGLVVNII